MRVPRNWLPAAGWCLATVVSVALAWVALLPVLHTASPDDGALPSVEHLRRTGADRGALPALDPPAFVPPTVRPTPGASDTPSPATTFRPPSTRPSSPSPDGPAPAPATTRPAPAPATTVDGWAVSTDTDGTVSYLRSFRVDGGQAVIRMTAGRVRLVTATPHPGYSVQTVQNAPDNLAVYFIEPDGHHFIIHALWWDDRPFAQVSEVGG